MKQLLSSDHRLPIFSTAVVCSKIAGLLFSFLFFPFSFVPKSNLQPWGWKLVVLVRVGVGVEGGGLGVEDTKMMDALGLITSAYVGNGQLNPSTRSFKIVTESSLVVMFLFQLYGRLVQTNIPHLLPLMVAAISVPGPEKFPRLKTHFIELKGAQVKTVSFLTYLLKGLTDYIRPHEESICKSIVNLLVTCPDSVSIRKELLVALKHVLGTDFKRGLFPLIDTLLEERVLVGIGRACFETLRPLAYSLLAEIVHHVRTDLSLPQMSRIIYLFSSNMHDASLSLSIHTTCARLMLNLVEPIYEKGVDQPAMDEAHGLLVFVALLRTCQPENKMLVKQALDVLMPALPRRLPAGESRMPIWIRYTKKILVEEGHSIPNLFHIFQLIVRHSDLFYISRAQFVPQMVNSLSRLGLPYNTTAENRRLAIELAGLVVGWERLRQNEMKVVPDTEGPGQTSDVFNPGSAAGDTKRSSDGSAFPDDISKRVKVEPGLQSLCVMSPGGASSIPSVETPGSAGQPDEEFKPNAAMEEMIINFLIRVALVIEPKDKEATSIYKQALELLSEALEVWPNANVKFNYLEKLLSSLQPSQSNKDPATALAQGLDVMNKVLEKQPHLFIRNNINQISQILEPCFNSKMLDEGKSLCTLLKMVFCAFPLEAANSPQDVKMLYQKVVDLIQKHLDSVISSQISIETANSMISFVLSVIKTLAEVQKNFMDPFLTLLTRVLQRLARDMGILWRFSRETMCLKRSGFGSCCCTRPSLGLEVEGRT